jgi:hypothetical protein
LSRDLPGTGSKTCACGGSGIIESLDFATAARQIAGKVERHPGRSYGLRPESKAAPPSQPRVGTIKITFAFDLPASTVQTPQNANWVQAERRRRGVGRAAWMPREPPPAMDGRWRRAHGASPSLRNDDEGVAKPGAKTLGYWVSFQVTRRRRNASAVRQNQDPHHHR